MAKLSTSLPIGQMMPLWAAQLNPLLANVLTQGQPLNDVVLVANTPKTFNHGLGKNQTGFIVTDIQSAAIVYRTQPFNAQTITLEASANCTINLWVY